jgi:excisionase family DNA binding protein
MREAKTWLKVGEAARLLGVSDPTLRKWTDAGKVPAFRTLGGHRRYLQADLLIFQQRLETTARYEAGMPERAR